MRERASSNASADTDGLKRGARSEATDDVRWPPDGMKLAAIIIAAYIAGFASPFFLELGSIAWSLRNNRGGGGSKL